MTDSLAPILVESPYAGDVRRNVAYARAALADCFERGEAPFASHLLYTQPGVLRDHVARERALAITAGLSIGQLFRRVAVYVDFGITDGMAHGIDRHLAEGRTVEQRRLPEWVKMYEDGLVAVMTGFGLFPASHHDWIIPQPR